MWMRCHRNEVAAVAEWYRYRTVACFVTEFKYLDADKWGSGLCKKPSKKTNTVGDRLTNTFTKDFCVRITNIFKKDFLCLDNEHIFGGDQGYTPEIMDEILTTARDLELERNVSPSAQEEDERGPIPTSAIEDILKKWEALTEMILE
ncbi:hypothetical protein TNCV_179821 [Trichonephila clavipes]|nr:hypothetical protein TNCV_179821 [Trichonephila clavipes]